MSAKFNLISALFILTGCAFGNSGTMSATVTDIPCAKVVNIKAYGGNLNTISDTTFSFGFSQGIYVFPLKDAKRIPAGNYFGYVPVPSTRPIAFQENMSGAQIRFGNPFSGLTFGTEELTFLAHVDSEVPADYRVDFIPDDPEKSRLSYSIGGEICGTL